VSFQFVGAAVAVAAIHALCPNAKRAAADVVVPHPADPEEVRS